MAAARGELGCVLHLSWKRTKNQVAPTWDKLEISGLCLGHVHAEPQKCTKPWQPRGTAKTLGSVEPWGGRLSLAACPARATQENWGLLVRGAQPPSSLGSWECEGGGKGAVGQGMGS